MYVTHPCEPSSEVDLNSSWSDTCSHPSRALGLVGDYCRQHVRLIAVGRRTVPCSLRYTGDRRGLKRFYHSPGIRKPGSWVPSDLRLANASATHARNTALPYRRRKETYSDSAVPDALIKKVVQAWSCLSWDHFLVTSGLWTC